MQIKHTLVNAQENATVNAAKNAEQSVNHQTRTLPLSDVAVGVLRLTASDVGKNTTPELVVTALIAAASAARASLVV